MLECPEMDINEEKNESNNAVGSLLSPESGRKRENSVQKMDLNAILLFIN